MKILIIEDCLYLGKRLKAALEEAYFVADLAVSAKEGRTYAATHPYDLIVLTADTMDGNFEAFAEHVYNSGRQTPMIVLSTNLRPAIAIEYLDAGADDCMRKPFQIEELIARVRAVLRRPRTLAEEQYSTGSITLDAVRYTVHVKEKPVKLTKKEFQLLKYLLQHSGRVLSREHILEHVWDINADPFSNTIETHIANLRRKLGDPGKRHIRTIPGTGYKIDV